MCFLLGWMVQQKRLPAGTLNSHPLEVCKPQSCGWYNLQPQTHQEVGFDHHQQSLPNNVTTPCCSKVLHLCDGHHGITWLQSLSCYRRGKFSLPLCPPSSLHWWQTGTLLSVPFSLLCVSVRSHIFSLLPLWYPFYLHAEIQLWTVIT